ncbi:MAG: GAF domain-containing protein [Bacteroidota bacterium]
MEDIDEDTFYMYCCYWILGSYYGYPVQGGGPMKVQIFNKDQGLTRTYKMLVNADMMEFLPTEKAVAITREDFESLLDNIDDVSLWKEKFPPESWIMRGINVVNLVDTTLDESIASISAHLLVKEDDTFEKIQAGIRSLINNPELEIGGLPLMKDRLEPRPNDKVSSILLREGEHLICAEGMCEGTFDLLINKREPLIIPDVERYHDQTNSKLSHLLNSLKFKSFILVPLVHENELLAFLEIGAYRRYELNTATMERLNQIIPILTLAHNRFRTEEQNEVEAIIQQECTTIHPSVKWKFEEEAQRFLTSQEANEHPVFKDIIFPNVYPLYGQLDIRNSSVQRNEAVVADLVKQIKGVKKVLKAVIEKTQMPIYKELEYRLDTHRNQLKQGLAAGSEHQILSFIKKEVYPIFEHLGNSDSSLRARLDEYNAMLDPELKMVYEARKKYDSSVNILNQKLATYLDNKQVEAQKMFSHYFERYKTDGVEYNMYIGQSIARDEKFDAIYLRNLRLWQLVTMCEMENEYRTLQGQLGMPIEIASLILVYNTALSVHFRMDEKQFDVEGAYNARYEIIKKRVDKAHIKGTKDRITQPGYIAIIYSQEQDAQEYKEYIQFLVAKGLVKPAFEDVELEDLQGISGLRALRVQVSYSGELTLDDFISEAKGASES